MLKTLRNVSLTALALGTAYGLGIITCVYLEVKLFAELVDAVNKDQHYED